VKFPVRNSLWLLSQIISMFSTLELFVYRVVLNWSNIPPTSHVQTDNSTLQMLFNTINQMN
jgi:hypothetical protein